MASAFASQLRQIAANSTHELDLRARRAAHAESLLFPRDVAARQDFDTIFAVCIEGFRELCSLDPRFRDYERNLFSAQAKDQDREQMNKSENEALDAVLDQCLGLLGGKILLRPGLRALEWLVRRFQVHIYNLRNLLLTVLPYHEMPVWKNVLSIVPQDKIVGEWKFIRPYLQSTWTVPRHAILYATTNDETLFNAMNRYVLDICRDQMSHPALMRFWGSVMVEAVSNRVDQARSGRKEVQRQRTEDVLLKVLPVLTEGFEMTECEPLIICCYTLTMVIASKAALDDHVIDSLLNTVANTLSGSQTNNASAFMTMAVMLVQKENKLLPKPVVNKLSKTSNLDAVTQTIANRPDCVSLLDALIASIVRDIKIKNNSSYLPFLEQVLRIRMRPGHSTITSTTVKPILAKVLQMSSDEEPTDTLRTELIDLLRKLNEEEAFSVVLSDVAQMGMYTPQHIESILGSTLLPLTVPEQTQPMSIEENDMEMEDPVLEKILGNIPSRTANISSFLSSTQDRLYEQLRDVFKLCVNTESSTQAFKSLPIWSTSDENGVLFASFLLRFVAEPNSGYQRATALDLLTSVLQKGAAFEIQEILPYILITLGDSVQSVRRAAANVAMAIANCMSPEADKTIVDFHSEHVTEQLKSVSGQHLYQVLQRGIFPTLEECVLDAGRISQVVGSILNGSSATDLKKSIRHSLFDILVSHAVTTTSMRMRLVITNLLADVNKVGTASKSKALSPLFDEWNNFDEASACSAAAKDNLDIQEIDAAVVSIFNDHIEDLLTHLLASNSSEGAGAHRSYLVDAVFKHISLSWKSSKEESRSTVAETLFKLVFSDQLPLARGAAQVLQTVSLSSETIAALLKASIDDIANIRNHPPPKKRRRTSHSDSPQVPKPASVDIAKLTFSLEIAENSKPESRPELLTVFFEALATLKNLRQLRRVDSPYLLNLCLSCILAVVDRMSTTSKNVDTSGVRAELVTECVRDCDNPQVLNTSLLLAASLSNLVPDQMVHDVMPVFTFVGQTMFAQDDEYSVQVMNRAVDQIVPVLITSLRKTKQKHNLLSSVANLLSSFVSAFDHIPQHRRVTFYQRIMNRVGAEDFGFIIIAMLSLRKREELTDVLAFINNLLEGFPVEVHLMTYSRLTTLVEDIFTAQIKSAEAVLGVGQSTSAEEKRSSARTILLIAKQTLASKSLKSNILRTKQLEGTQVEQRRKILEGIFGQTLHLVRARKEDETVQNLAKDCLKALLELVSLRELISILPKVLEDVEGELKPQSLRLLSARLENNPPKDSKTRLAAMQFLGMLCESLPPTLDSTIAQASLACMDRIIETYGRKDLDSVLMAATTVVNRVLPRLTKQQTGRTEINHKHATVAMLTLATSIEVLKEAAVPVVVDLLSQLEQLTSYCVNADRQKSPAVLGAFCTAMSAVLSSVAFLVTEGQLTDLLKAITGLTNDLTTTKNTDTPQHDLLRTIARKVEFDTLVQSLEASHDVSNFTNKSKMRDFIYLSSQLVDKAPKSVVHRHAEAFSEVFLLYLQARENKQSPDTQLIDTIESQLQEVSIKFIYKLNDTTFRPLFESWIEWATKAEDIDENDRLRRELRQTALFNLLQHFFQTLKAIVTSYAGHLLKPMSSAMSQFASLATLPSKSANITPEQQGLFTSTLSLLRATAMHDVDGFYTAPSHFDSVAGPLVECLQLATHKTLRTFIYSHVIPAIVTLASATIDSPSHHHTLSHMITELRRSSSTQVRLASIKTLHALIDDEEDGDSNNDDDDVDAGANVAVGSDWIANTIGVGSGEGEGAREGGGGAAGEVMIYVNEMLEDDDEDVEREVRRWVQRVRDRVGEEVFEM